MALLGPFIASEGLNTAVSNFNCPPNQAVDMDNCFARQGTIINRGSIAKLNASAITSNLTIMGLGYFVDPAQASTAGRTPLIIAVAGSGSAAKKIYTGPLISGAITFTDRTGAVVLSSNISQNLWQFATLNGIFIGTGNSLAGDLPFKITTYNGNAAALGGSPPSANCICVVNNFVFLAGNYSATSTFSKVYWSAVSDPETWPAANNLDVRVNDGDCISALSSVGQDLIIFKTRSTSRLSTTTTATGGTVTLGPLSTISDAIGCAGPDAVKKLPDGRIVFLDQYYRLQIFDGTSFTEVSDQVYPSPNVNYAGTATSTLALSNHASVIFTNQDSMAISPLTGQVHINYGGTLNGDFIYSYKENTWATASYFTNSSSLRFKALLFAPPTQVGDSILGTLLAGTGDGFCWSLEGSGAPNWIDASTPTCSIKTSIQLPPDFVPRTILIPATIQSGGTLAVTLGYNGTMNGSSSTVITRSNSALWYLIDVKQTATTIPRPLTIQILIQPTAGKTFSIYPLFISDEVLSNVS